MTGKPYARQGVRSGNTAAFMAQKNPDADAVNFFPTPPWGFRAAGELIRRFDPGARSVWECACGAGHGVHALNDDFPVVHASDAYLYDRNVVFDFLSPGQGPFGAVDWIVTNPPFDPAAEFVRLAWDRASRGVAMLLRPAFSETVGRYELLNVTHPVGVKAWFAERLPMMEGRWDPEKSTASAYQWLFWLKPCVDSPTARLARQVRAELGMALDWTIPPGTRERLSRPSDERFMARAA